MRSWTTLRVLPGPEKSWYICKDVDEPRAQEDFDQHNPPIQMTCGHQHLGFFIGSAATNEMWINDKVVIWTAAVETLSRIADKWPQTALLR